MGRTYRSRTYRILSSDDLQCDGGYIKNEKCACYQGYYSVQGSSYYKFKCQKCTNNCLTCSSSTKCSICEDGYYNNKGICSQCEGSCKTCSDYSRCTTCTKPLYLTIVNSCQLCNVNSKMYIEVSTNICKNCDVSCQSCQDSSANKCTKCATGYQKSPPQTTSTTFSCIQCDISNGYFISGQTCTKCHDTCLTCNGAQNTNCLTCKDGKVLNESSICVDCSKSMGYYLKSSNLCAKCNDNCLTCVDTSQKCTSCRGGLSLKDTTCVDCSQQSGYYRNSENKCIKCHESCSTCSSYSTCTACAQGYYWNDDRKNCMKCDTNNGFFIQVDQCLKCHQYCLKCTSRENNQTACSSCKSSYDWIQSKDQPIGNLECGICDEQLGFYRENGSCKKCQNNCDKCQLVGGVLKCLDCEDNYFFDGDSETTCVQCQGAKYVDINKCRNCHSSCKKCFDGTEQGCEICADTYYRLESEKKCVLCDQQGQAKISMSRCENCIGNCNQCNTGDLAKCITCKAGFFLMDDGRCEPCNGNYYIQGIYCKQCDKSCNGCDPVNPSQCLSCASGYLQDNPSLTAFNCIECPSFGFFNQSGVCSQCDLSCFKCNGPNNNNCISCYEGHNQASGVCLESCPTGTVNAKCPCDGSCKSCKDPYLGDPQNRSSACTSCGQGKYLKLNDSVGAGYYTCDSCNEADGVYKNDIYCLICQQPGCKQCKAGGVNDCTLCIDGKFLNESGICEDCSIPGKTQYLKKCYQCPTNCDQCSFDSTNQKTVCIKCSASYKLNLNKECIICPTNKFYIDGDSCLPCYPSCATCSGGSLEKHCTSCENNLFFIEEQCQSCPTQKYTIVGTGITKQCLKCHESCLKCSNIGEEDCTQCMSDKYFFEENSKKYCKTCQVNQGYYIENQQNCKKCDSPCATCHGSGFEQCDTCIDNYALFEGRICRVCDVSNQKFIELSTQICTSCDSSCQTCNGESEIDCLTCPSGKFQYIDKRCGECDEIKENVLRQSPSCIKCHESCSEGCKTSDITGCNKCKSGLFFVTKANGDKVCEECPSIGFYTKDQECIECHGSCKTCQGGTDKDCVDCKQDLSFMNDDTCKECPKEKFFINEENECLECPLHCVKCKNSLSCQECENGYQLDIETNQCVICSQKSGYFIKNEFCLKCNPACKECSGSTDLDCIECNDNYSRVNLSNKCVYCPSNAQYNQNYNNCIVCQDICTFCSIGSHLPFDISNSSVINQINNKDRNQYCKECKCKACSKGYFNFDGRCTSNCSEIGENFTNDKTSPSCICKENFPYQVFEVYKEQKKTFCSKIIPNGFFCNNNKKCQECQPNCHTCQNQTQCSFCNEGYVLWEGICHKTCPNYTNLVENKEERICSCPEGYIYKIPKQQKEGICIEPLTLVQVDILNSFMSQTDNYSQGNVNISQTSYNNFIRFRFNREPLEDEKQNFNIFINQNTLIKDSDYFIKGIKFIQNELIVEVEVKENRRAETITYTINGQQQTIKLKNAILTTYKYNQSQVGEKGSVTSIKYLSSALAPQNGRSKDMLDFLKKFQFLCFLSNFVQVLGPITLLKDSIPPQVYVGAEMGASFIFNSVPSSDEVGYSPELTKSSQLTENQLQYQEEDTHPSPYSIMYGLGLNKYLYSNFMILHLIIDVSSLLILILLIARRLHPEKQYSLIIVDKIANQVVSYSQGSITASLFCIVYSLYHTESSSLAAFQITITSLLFAEVIYLVKYRSDVYINKNIPSFFENINYQANGSKSYIIVSFIKKYLVISFFLGLCLSPITCSILISIVFFLKGLYILRYRFFFSRIINIVKIIQEWFISFLFILLAVAISRYVDILKSNVISDDQLIKIEKLSFVILIFFIVCLATSLLIFLIRLMISIYNFFKLIQSKLKDKQQLLKVIECENLQSNSQLQVSFSRNISSKLIKSIHTLSDAKIKEYEKKPNISPTSTEGDI